MKPSGKPDPSPLLFDWKTTDRSLFRLALAVILTLSAFVGLFLSFRILTPEVRHITARPHQLLVLNPNVPAERALIHQAIDRSFPLLPTGGATEPTPAGAVMPTFKPGILSYELKTKPITPSATGTQKAQFFALDLDVVTPQRRGPSTEPLAPPATPSILRAVIAGDIATRSPDNTTLPDIALIEPSKPQFRVAVGPLGQVIVALPLAATEDAQIMSQLRDAVAAFRFKPATGKPVEWGNITFRWEKEAAP